jgi:hypothetical protein
MGATSSLAPPPAGIGVVALAVLGLLGLLCGLDDRRVDDAWLDAPRTGDVYIVHSGPSHAYSLLKVLRAGGNGVELVANQFQTTDRSSITSLNTDRCYSKEPFVITRLDLQIMRRKGQLVDVDRP